MALRQEAESFFLTRTRSSHSVDGVLMVSMTDAEGGVRRRMGCCIDASTPSIQSVRSLATTVKLSAKERQTSTARAHNIRHRKALHRTPARRVRSSGSFSLMSLRAAFGSRGTRVRSLRGGRVPAGEFRRATSPRQPRPLERDCAAHRSRFACRTSRRAHALNAADFCCNSQ